MKWISKTKYIEESGLSDGVLRGWFDRHLHRGVHYQVIGHTTMINVELVDEWITQQVSDPKVKVCGYVDLWITARLTKILTRNYLPYLLFRRPGVVGKVPSIQLFSACLRNSSSSN